MEVDLRRVVISQGVPPPPTNYQPGIPWLLAPEVVINIDEAVPSTIARVEPDLIVSLLITRAFPLKENPLITHRVFDAFCCVYLRYIGSITCLNSSVCVCSLCGVLLTK